MTAAPASPLEPAPAGLTAREDVWLKREDVHELGAFKWRGALPTMDAFLARGAREVVTASTGNHGAATAWAAARAGIRATVFAPVGASRAKLALIEGLGAGVREVGRDLDEAKELARAHAAAAGAAFFEDGAEPTQFAGYATIAEELVAQLGRAPAAVLVPVGNGALLAGVGGALRRLAPEAERIGVAAKEAPVMALSHAAGRVVESTRSETFADGLAVRVAIPLAVEQLATAASRFVLVSERAIARAVGAYAGVGLRVEGSGAATLAALDQLEADGPVVLLVTGRNIDDALLARACDAPGSFPD